MKDVGSKLFENLITMEELLAELKFQYSKWTIYKWVREGMPHRKVRSKLWFPKDDVMLWILRR